MASEKLTDFVQKYKWVAEGRGGSIFKTDSALEFFIKQHRDELVESGELILGSGRQVTLIGKDFDKVVLKIKRRISEESKTQ